MMRPFFTSLSAACCSLGILTLAQCGGSSSDAEGLAPSTIGSKVLNMQVTRGLYVPVSSCCPFFPVFPV